LRPPNGRDSAPTILDHASDLGIGGDDERHLAPLFHRELPPAERHGVEQRVGGGQQDFRPVATARAASVLVVLEVRTVMLPATEAGRSSLIWRVRGSQVSASRVTPAVPNTAVDPCAVRR
jgi:hypothetical protein